MKSAICAIARNECEYLEEWITYHLDLGFTHIFLYDNNDAGDDSVRMLLQSMPAAGQYAAAMPSIPMNMEFGGVTVFILDLERLEKF